MKIHSPSDEPLPSILIPADHHPTVCAVPLAGQRLPAGFPSPADEYIDSALDLNEYLVRNKASTFFFRVAGDSMINARINDGDLIVADRSIIPRSGHIVVAAVNGEFTIKRLYRRGCVVELRAENPCFEPIRFQDGEELVVWGVVTGVVCRFVT